MTTFNQIIEAIDQHNTHDVTRLLASYKNKIEINAFKSEANHFLKHAVLKDNTDAARCIIPFVDMTRNVCLALVKDEHSEIFELLYQTSDPQYVIDKITKQINDPSTVYIIPYHDISRERYVYMIDVIGQRLKADQERQILSQQVQDKPSGARSKM